MKKCLYLLISVLVLTCTSDSTTFIDNPELLGKWKLIEVLVDLGDGSGTFQPINYNKTVEFFNNATVTSSGYLCFISEESISSTGTFEIISSNESDTNFDGKIKPNSCEFSETEIYFDINSDNKLILWFPCIEGCGEKYEKIQ